MSGLGDNFASYAVVCATSALLSAGATTVILDATSAWGVVEVEPGADVVAVPHPAPEPLSVAVPAPPGAPNVVFLMWDTVRADRLSLYGHRRPTTPALSRIAADGAVWDRAISPSFWTVPSHASLFTGLPVRAHGTDAANPWLADRQTTLAEWFRDHGWATWAFTANPNISPDTNLAQGFDVLLDQSVEPWGTRARAEVAAKAIPDDASSPRSPAWPAGRLEGSAKDAGPVASAALLDWLDEKGPGDKPFFAFINFMEVHAPRLPSRDARRAVGLVGGAATLALRTPAGFEDLARANRSEKPYTRAEDEAMRAVYDASVWELDRVTGELIDALDQRGHRDDTVVVIVSDHGDEIGEHRLYGHNFSVYDTLVRVPLVIRGPGVAHGRHRAPVSTAGLFGTLAHLARIPVEGALTLDTAAPVAELTWAHGIKPGLPDRDADGTFLPNRRRFTAIYDARWKLIRSSAGELELFDLDRDPAEERNLAGDALDRVAALETAMDSWLEGTPRPPDIPLPDEERQRRRDARRDGSDQQAAELAALGYVQ